MPRIRAPRGHLAWAIAAFVAVGLVAFPRVVAASSEGNAAAQKDARAPRGITILENSFNGATATADDGPHVWVAGANEVTEVDAFTGRIAWDAKGTQYGFRAPSAIAYADGRLWVANSSGNSVTELDASTGALVRVLHGASLDLNGPDAVAAGGGDVWIANLNRNSVTELDASTGGLVRVIAGAFYDFHFSTAAAYADGLVWIGSGLRGEVTVLDATTGLLVHVTDPASFGVAFVKSIAVCGTKVWATSAGLNALEEFSASTGALEQTVLGATHGYHLPVFVACGGSRLWVASALRTPILTELDSSTGALIKVEHGATNGFAFPSALTCGDGRLWMLGPDDTLTELHSTTGAHMTAVRGTYYGFEQPIAVAAGGHDVWVANAGYPSSSVSEVNASTRAPVRIVEGGRTDIDDPTAIADDGTHVWIANGAGDSVTELRAATGRLVRVARGHEGCPKGLECGPSGLVTDGTDVWVEDFTPGAAISELDASTGEVVGSIRAGANGLVSGMAYGGGHLWVADLASSVSADSISEIDPATDHVVKVLYPHKVRLRDGAYEYDASNFSDVAYSHGRLWVVSSDLDGNDAVTEFDATSGAEMRVIDRAADGFNEPTAIAADGSHVWVAESDCQGADCGDGTTVTELDASNGQLVGVLSAAAYGFDDPGPFAEIGADLWVTNSGSDTVTVLSTTSSVGLRRRGLSG